MSKSKSKSKAPHVERVESGERGRTRRSRCVPAEEDHLFVVAGHPCHGDEGSTERAALHCVLRVAAQRRLGLRCSDVRVRRAWAMRTVISRENETPLTRENETTYLK